MQDKTDTGIRLYKKLYSTASPVTEKIKPGVLFNIRDTAGVEYWKQEQNSLLRSLNLSAECLYEGSDFITVYLYDVNILGNTLQKPENLAFLKAKGYTAGPAERELHRLKEFYSVTDYPHEIGLFLGYPLADVRGFIKNGGRNYKLNRYWKVYGDTELALELFSRIDRARANAAAYLASAYPE